MLGFVLRRVVTAVVMLLLLTFLTFVMYYAIPAEPGRILVGERATREQVAEANRRLGADQPVPVQYVKFVWRLMHGDLGVSWGTVGEREDGPTAVAPTLVDAAAVTASVVLGGAAILLMVAVPLGALAAVREGTRFDRLSTVAVVACISLPTPVVALLLQTSMADMLGLAPADGYCTLVPGQTDEFGFPVCGGPSEWASHLVLPWLTFALFFGALYMGVTRTRMIETLREPYVRTARAKGAPESQVVRSHALRNAVLPLMTMLAMDIGTALGLTVFIESVFALPGMGRLWVESLGGQIGGFDLPVILGLVLFTGIIVIIVNLAVDLLYGVVDPRVREAGSVRARVMR